MGILFLLEKYSLPEVVITPARLCYNYQSLNMS